MNIVLITAEGQSLRTSNVERHNVATHIRANDRLADEARCLLAWEATNNDQEPTGWDGEDLLYTEDIGDATPVEVIWE